MSDYPITWDGLDWTQFGYASVPRLPGRSGGGWGVFAGTAQEPDRAWVSTRIVSRVRVPEFYEPKDLRARPMRMRAGYARPAGSDNGRSAVSAADGGRRLVVAHSVDAGPDPTNRPGNVVSHVASCDEPTPRPIELWGSPDWATPYGPRELAETRLPETLRPGRLTRTACLHWASGQVSLGWVLDAVQHARSAGQVLLLATRTPDEAAQWIAAISHLTARTLSPSFSTFEDATSLAPAMALGLQVIGIDADAQADNPTGPNAIAGRDQTMLIDLSWAPPLPRERDPRWQLPDGTQVPVGIWHSVVLDLLETGPAVVDLMRRCDQIGEAVGADGVDVPFYWPLAVALLTCPVETLDGRKVDVLERGKVLAAVLRDAPDSAPDEVLDPLLDEVDDAMRRQLLGSRNAGVRELVAATLVERALADSDVGTAPAVPAAERAAVAARLGEEIGAAIQAGDPAVLRYLRENDLLLSAEGFPVLADPRRLQPMVLAEPPALAEPPRLVDPGRLPEPRRVDESVRLEDPRPLDEPTREDESRWSPAGRSVLPAQPDGVRPARADRQPAREPAPAERWEPEQTRALLETGLSELLAVIESRPESNQRLGMAEAVLRLRGAMPDGTLRTDRLSPALAPFAGHYMAAVAEARPEWTHHACLVWQQLAASEHARAAGDRLLGQIADVLVRNPQLAAQLPADVAQALAGRFGHTPGSPP